MSLRLHAFEFNNELYICRMTDAATTVAMVADTTVAMVADTTVAMVAETTVAACQRRL